MERVENFETHTHISEKEDSIPELAIIDSIGEVEQELHAEEEEFPAALIEELEDESERNMRG
jgi:hypothetical protein